MLSLKQSRRKFLAQLSLLSAVPVLGGVQELFAAAPVASSIQFGYSAITWGGNDALAIREISSLGFEGIQLRANAYQTYGQRPEELKKLLDGAKLKLAMFSSGNANVNTGKDEEEIDRHIVHAGFVKALGGNKIQVTNSSRPRTGPVAKEDLVKYGKLLTEIGKRTAMMGVETTYHNHMGQLGQTPEEVATILENTDPKYVGFLLDIAHYQQGGGDPAAAIRKYGDRIRCLHIKDVKNKEDGNGYVFVELGQGRVDLPAVFDALKEINYKGYAVVELDAVPVKGRTPLESGQITKDYLGSKLKIKI